MWNIQAFLYFWLNSGLLERATRTWMQLRDIRALLARLRQRTFGKPLVATTPWSPRNLPAVIAGPSQIILQRRALTVGTIGVLKLRPTTNTAQKRAGRPGTTTGIMRRVKRRRVPQNLPRNPGIMQNGSRLTTVLHPNPPIFPQCLYFSLCSSNWHFQGRAASV